MNGIWCEFRSLIISRSEIGALLEEEREQLPLFFPVALGVGILYGVFFPFFDWHSFGIFSAAAVFVSCVVFRHHKILLGLCLAFSLGVYVAQTGGILKTELLTQKKFLTEEYDNVRFSAKVKFIDETHPTMKNMRRITLQDIRFAENPGLDFIKTAKLTCPAVATDGISPGDIVEIRGKLSPFKPPAIPGAFDQQQYNSLVGIDATGIAYYVELKEVGYNAADLFARTRRVLTQKITQLMPGAAGGLASALLTGDKSPIPTDVREKYIRSGTAHILAISGLHMSLVASAVFLILVKIFQYVSCVLPRVNSRRYAAIATIPATFLYLALSGFSPSATRAFIMTTIFLLGVIIGRSSVSLRSVAVAAFLILLFDAGSLFLVSFQLSFCAVVALIAFYETNQHRISSLRNNCQGIAARSGFYIIASLISTTIASFATFPVSIATFNRLSLSGFLGNLIAIPTVSFIVVPLGLFSLTCSWFTDIFLNALGFVLDKLTVILGIVSDIPGSNIIIKSPSLITLYIIIFGGVFLCLLKTKARWIGGSAIAIGLVAWVFAPKPYIICPPGGGVVCFVEDGRFYTTSLRKGRRAAEAVQRNLGFDGKLKKRPCPYELPLCEVNTDSGLYVWSDTSRTLADKTHPFCPARFE
ncbi:MAG: ComEC/Rec2 family competence protein [Alphaproteobacteria bacterium]|nr:ComEC/Rec2 family competence protein [Alphaproteobacteria bacterium]